MSDSGNESRGDLERRVARIEAAFDARIRAARGGLVAIGIMLLGMCGWILTLDLGATGTEAFLWLCGGGAVFSFMLAAAAPKHWKNDPDR